MIIETKIDFKKYVQLMYILTYRRRGMIFASIIGIFMFVISILYFIGIIETTEFPWLPIFFAAVIIIGMPFSVYYSARKNYYSHGRFQEKLCMK